VEDVRLSTTAADKETAATPATAAPRLVNMGTLDDEEEAFLDVADAEALPLLGPASATVANLDEDDWTRSRHERRAPDDGLAAAAAAADAAIGERSAAIRIMIDSTFETFEDLVSFTNEQNGEEGGRNGL
jgi:methionine synthase II (cobalamin-independent)